MEYKEFLDRKSQSRNELGFKPIWMPDFLFDFQRALVDRAITMGRSAVFADCGLGKTPMQLVWAENIVRKTNRPVLILTPFAVSAQTKREAEKFDIECFRNLDGRAHRGINVTNYERLEHFNCSDFAGVICDESSILKSFDGVRRQQITNFMRKIPFRLLCTATAAPNDYIELGTSSEALGFLGYTDMLGRFFKNDQGTIRPMRYTGFGAPRGRIEEHTDKWRLKRHAEIPFWRWVCSWARACRKPSDLGFDDGQFILPELIEREHVTEARTLAPGMLFSRPAVGLREQREERGRTVQERCEMVASFVSDTGQPALVWCHLNVEGDLLEKLIPDAVQVSGDETNEAKEEKLIGFTDGNIRVLVTKPKIGAWGLNFQHCNHLTFFPSHSFEQYYQGVRRCWRFGQKRPVTVDIVTTEGEQEVMRNLQRKSKAADVMFSNLVQHMNDQFHINRSEEFTKEERVPVWL